MNVFLKIFLLILFCGTAEAQPVTWTKYFDLVRPSVIEECTDVLQTFDGGYTLLVISGSIELIKVDAFGKLEWYRLLDSTHTQYGFVSPKSFQQTKDSGYIIAGEDDSSRAFLFKMDKHGDLEWRKYFYNLGYNSHFVSVKITNDNGFIVCGDISNSSNSKYYIVKTDSIGNSQWDEIFMDLTDNYFLDIICSKDGFYYLVGATSSISSSTGILKKIDSMGDLIWSKNFFSGGRRLLQNENGFIYTGGGQGTLYINKFDTSGYQIWQKSYFTGGYYFGMCLTENDNITFSGVLTDSAGSNVIVTRFDSSGSLIRIRTLNSGGNFYDASFCIKFTNDNGFIIGGKTTFGGSSLNYNPLAIKTDSLFFAPKIVGIENNVSEIKSHNLIFNYPNPFNGETIINYTLNKIYQVNFKIYDLLGREVSQLINSNQPAGNYSVKFNGNILNSGIYFCVLKLNNVSVDIKKLILVK